MLQALSTTGEGEVLGPGEVAFLHEAITRDVGQVVVDKACPLGEH